AWLAAVGRLGPAFLSVRRTRSVEESLVLLWLFARRRRNAQRATVIRCAVLCSLAVVAKKVDSRAPRARRFHGNDGAHRFAVGFARFAGLDLRCCCRQCHVLIASAIQISLFRR